MAVKISSTAMKRSIKAARKKAQQAIAGVDADTQEFWTRTMWGLSNYFESASLSDPTERATRALDQLQIALQHLRSAARLEIANLAFCDKIDGFGVYHTFDQDIFRPGQIVLLYAEVRNFKPKATFCSTFISINSGA